VEIVRDGVDGFVVDDVPAAVEAVSGLSELRRTDCRARVEACFEVGVVAGHYEKIYRRMVQR
jgi:glycosyltransferase involved in cell wall biosynthesis